MEFTASHACRSGPAIGPDPTAPQTGVMGDNGCMTRASAGDLDQNALM